MPARNPTPLKDNPLALSMNLTSKSSIKNLLQKHHLRPIKYLGQHFLIDQKVLQKIIQTADLMKKDTVLEIGPGLGTLTLELAKKAGQVIAVEKDKRMCQILKEILKDYKNVEIIQGDILKIFKDCPWRRRQGQSLKIVANIPYYLTSPLIRKFLESSNPPQEMILLIQKEVAQRICAQPPKMSLLAIAVQFYAQPKIITYVSKKSFWPQPKVDSAIIKIVPHPFVILNDSEESSRKQLTNKFFNLVKAGFASPRKQLANNLSKNLKIDKEKIKKALTKIGLDPKSRAENLSVGDWEKLMNEV